MALAAGPGLSLLRQRLLAQDLPPYRSVDGEESPWHRSPAGTDASLQRFLVARKGDVVAAMNMFMAHLEWRRQIFPIPREGRTAQLLDEGRRFSHLRTDAEGCPVLLINFLFGHFVTDEVSEVEVSLASVRFFEDSLSSLEAQGKSKLCCIAFGCPPPVAWSQVMVKIFQNNYPERLKLAIVYPIPPKLVMLCRKVMWFLDENTRSKIDMESDEEPLLKRFGYQSQDLQEGMRGGCDGVGAYWKPDARKLLGMAYNFLLPHGRQVAELERSLFQAASSKASAPSKQQHEKPEEHSSASWTDLLFACCMVRPSDSCLTLGDSTASTSSSSTRLAWDRKNGDAGLANKLEELRRANAELAEASTSAWTLSQALGHVLHVLARLAAVLLVSLLVQLAVHPQESLL